MKRGKYLGCLLVIGLLSACQIVMPSSGTSVSKPRVVKAVNQTLPTQQPVVSREQISQVKLQLATNYYRANKLDAALVDADAAVEFNPNSADAYSLRGLIYMQLADFTAAEKNFSKAVELNKNNSNILHNYALLLCEKRDFARADAYFRQVLNDQSYSNKVATWLAQGVCYINNNKINAANRALQQALKIDANNPTVLYELARVQLLKNNLNRAAQTITNLNSSSHVSAQSLWLEILIAHQLTDFTRVEKLGQILQQKYPNAEESGWYTTKQFNHGVK